MHLLALLNFTNFVATAGYGAVFILSLLQSCCVPTSSELTLGFAGVLAAQGKLSLVGVIAVGVAGEVVGAYVAWAVGHYAGRAAVDRFGRYVLVTHHDLDRAEEWYDRHERFGVFGSRLLPVIRNFVALPAGIAEVPLGRFGLLTAAGSLLWDGAWAGIGYGVGGHWHAIASGFSDIGYVLAVLAVGVVALGALHRYRSYKAATSGLALSPSEVPVPGAAASEGAPEDTLLRSALDSDAPRRRLPRPARRRRRPSVPSSAAPPGADRWITSSSGRPPGSPGAGGLEGSPISPRPAAGGRRAPAAHVATPVPARSGRGRRRSWASRRAEALRGVAADQVDQAEQPPVIGSPLPAPPASTTSPEPSSSE